MEGIYLIAKKVVDKKYPEDINLKPFFVAALYGMLCKYKQYYGLVCDLFLKMKIIFDNQPVNIILDEHGYSSKYVDSDTEFIRTYGVSDNGNSFLLKDNKVVKDTYDPMIVCSTYNVSVVSLLNTFCHEFEHLIKGMIKNGDVFPNNNITTFYNRVGLDHTVYQYNHDKEETVREDHFVTIDEAINCIQTTESLEEIVALKEFVTDEKMIDFLNMLNIDEMDIDYGYEVPVSLLRRLWKYKEFRQLVESNIVPGDIIEIVNRFDKTVGEEYAYNKLSNILDSIMELSEENKDNDMLNQLIDEANIIIDKYIAGIKRYHKK